MPGGAAETMRDDTNHTANRRQLLRGLAVQATVPGALRSAPAYAAFDHHAPAWNDRPAAPRDTVRMAVS